MEALLVHVGADSILEAARRLAVNPRVLHRWTHTGVPAARADGLAVQIGMHPTEIWPSFLEDVELPVGTYCGIDAHDRCAMRQCSCDCHFVKGPAMPEVHPLDKDIVWEEPPKKRARRNLVDSVAPFIERLHARPGEWCRLLTYDGRTSAQSQAGKLRKAYPEVEFVAGSLNDGSAIWARSLTVGIRPVRAAK